MGSVKSKVSVEAVEKEVQSNPVVLYSKSGCGFCTKAKSLLSEEKIEFKETNLDEFKISNSEQYKAFVNGLVYTTKTTGVPQIFICGKYIGGFTELSSLRDAKLLLEKVAECTGENAKREQ